MKVKFLWILIYAPLVFVCIQFYRSNLSQWDMTGHLIASKNFAESIWPNFIGWNPNQFSGYPQGYFYPSFFHWVIGVFSKFFPIEFTFKCLVVLSTLSLPLSIHRLGKSIFPDHPKKAMNIVVGAMFLYLIPKGPIGGDLYSTFRIGLVNQNWAMNFFFLFLAEHWNRSNDRFKFIRTGFWLGITLLSHAIVGLAALICLLIPLDFKQIIKNSVIGLIVSAAWVFPYLLYRKFASGMGINFLNGFNAIADREFAFPMLIGAFSILVLLALKNRINYHRKDRFVQAFIVFSVIALAVEILYRIPFFDIAHLASIHFYRLQGFLIFFGLIPLFYDWDEKGNKIYRYTLKLGIISFAFTSSYLCIDSLKNDYNLGFRFTENARVLVYQGSNSNLSLVSPHQLSNLLQREGVKTLNGLFAESSQQTSFYLATLNELFSKPMVWGVEPMPYSPRLAPKHLRALGVDGIVSQEKINPAMKKLLSFKAIQEDVNSEVYYNGNITIENFSAYLLDNLLVERLPRIRLVEKDWVSERYEWWLSEKPEEWLLNAENRSVQTIKKMETSERIDSTTPQYRRNSPTEIQIHPQSTQWNWYLVKESYFPNWKAYSLDGSDLPIFEAVPNQIAVQSNGPFILKFEPTTIETVSQWLTWFSILIAICWLIVSGFRKMFIYLFFLVLMIPTANASNELLYDRLVAGSYHFCKIFRNQVSCWGINHFGQFGADHKSSARLATPTHFWPKDLVDGDAGLGFTCFHDKTNVYCAGKIGKTHSLKPFLLFKGSDKILKIVASHLGLCVLFDSQNQQPRCYGKTESFELSNIKFPKSVNDLSLGANQLCILTSGEVHCLSPAENSSKWVKIMVSKTKGDWNQISSGANHSCGIRTENSISNLYCWGDHRFYQTGQPPEEANTSTNHIKNPDGYSWKKVSAGDSHTCALTTNGKLYCFGDNSKAQTDPINRTWEYKVIPNPKAIPAFTNIQDLKTKGLSTCALLDHYYSCWGAIGNGISDF